MENILKQILSELQNLNDKYEGLNDKYEGLNDKYESLDKKVDSQGEHIQQLIKIVGTTNAYLEEIRSNQQKQERVLEKLSLRSITQEAEIDVLRMIK